MKLRSQSFSDGQKIPKEFVFGITDMANPANHMTLSQNHNPHLAWEDVPENVKGFVLICHDPDAPSQGNDVNREDRTVPADLPRVDFFNNVYAWAIYVEENDHASRFYFSVARVPVPAKHSFCRCLPLRGQHGAQVLSTNALCPRSDHAENRSGSFA